ncbi:MAG TPA: transaldolase [Puia sp.]|jgi:transaldolase/transaldolase/glucose-6-phosphate isomerase|nr:transaldolase [Puia sp.]
MESSNTVRETYRHGQSIWLDHIDRQLIQSGTLEQLIRDQGLTGMTSNPTIFEKSISGGNLYTQEIKDLIASGKGNEEIFYCLALEDIEAAADLFQPVYRQAERPGADGFVSLEVSPRLAHDTAGTIQQANLLWHKAHRNNVMIKIPGTAEGIPAIRQCISEGININITLLFGLNRYQQVIDAYLSGLEDRLRKGQPVRDIASVASFFLSRIDVLVDPMLEQKGLRDLKGKTAIALAKKAYTIYRKSFTSDRWMALAQKGARPQRLLWASTSTKDPSFPDTKYVEALIGKDTIDTVPLETLHSFLDHGKVADTLESDVPEADRILESVQKSGIDLEEISQRLETEGIDKFVKPYDKLMDSIEAYRANQ